MLGVLFSGMNTKASLVPKRYQRKNGEDNENVNECYFKSNPIFYIRK